MNDLTAPQAPHAHTPTLNAPFSSAELCRRNGWGVGTRIVGSEGSADAPLVIEICWLGQSAVVAQRISYCGRPWKGEMVERWNLSERDWHIYEPTKPASMEPPQRNAHDPLAWRR